MSSTDAYGAWMRAERLIELGRYKDAEREVRGALVSEPNDPFFHSVLAKCLCLQRRFKPALAEADETIRLDPESDTGYFMRAMILLNAGKSKRAVEAATRAVEVNSEDADNLGLLARCYERLNRWAEALDAADRGLSLNPQHARCAAVRADALRALGRSDEARAVLRGNLENDPEDADAHADLGWHALRSGDRVEAMVHFREALRLDPELLWARQGLAAAMQSRSPLYGWFFRLRLWVADKPAWWQWALLGVALAGPRLIRMVTRGSLWGSLAADVVNTLAFMFWYLWTMLPAIGTVLLWSDREGRHALNDEQRAAVRWFLPALLVAAAAALAAPWISKLTTVLIMLPTVVIGCMVPAVYSIRAAARRRWMLLIMLVTVLVAALPALGILTIQATIYGFVPARLGLLLVALAPMLWFTQILIVTIAVSVFADTITKWIAGPEGTQQTII